MGKKATWPVADPLVTEFARKVRAAFNVEKIIFFGSRVRGDHLIDSDYDFIIVSDDFKGLPFTERMTLMYEFWDSNLPIEPLCYTREEFHRKSNQISMVSDAVREGIEV
ncbi:MAG: hypothetical protein E3J65_02140 [Dehalococcoidia bacterium]|nr:MAG: hypothetical protein E3J65_02140 [Dehalococcoidia bacterium]